MTRTRVFAVLAAAVVVLAWSSAGTKPVTDAVKGAVDPADFIRDYVTARVRLEDGRGAPPLDEAGNDRAAALGAPRVVLLSGPFHLHPPPGLFPVLAVAWLPWRTAARVWTMLSLAALLWLAWSLEGLRDPRAPRHRGRFALLAAALALWPPVLHCFEKGQWSIALAALIAAGSLDLERDRPTRAGVLFGVAASLKTTPLVLLGLLVARSRRGAVAMAATFVGLALVATAALGLEPWRAFFADAPRNVAAWGTWLANTVSLQGVYARLFTESPFTRPLVVAPALSRGAFALTAVALLAAAVAVAWRRARADAGASRGPPALWSAAWLALPVLLNPLGWTHVAVMLLPPLAVGFRDGGPRTRATAVLVLAALSLPRQRLAAWAGPMQIPPAPALVLGVHAFAALALYVALLAGERSTPA
jgi:hypothetical protein